MATPEAERQKKYRKKNGESGKRCINMWLANDTLLALQRLAKLHDMPQPQILEKLITEADEQFFTTSADMEATVTLEAGDA